MASVGVGSPLLNVSGFTTLIPKTINQVLTGGGSFQVNAVADANNNLQGVQNVIQQPGSVINVSGGFVAYAGGQVKTTRLLGADGRLYDIGSANPNQAHVIVGGFTVDHPHWNVTETYASLLSSTGHFEPDSISGASAGSVNVMAVAPILAGSFIGDIVAGTQQRAGGRNTMPAGAGRLSVTFTGTTPSQYNVVLEPTADAFPNAGADPYGLGSFSFGANWTPKLVNSLFPIFSDTLSATGFRSISINTGVSTLSMPSDATLTVRPGGSVTLGNVATIDGTINAPSGNITLTGTGSVNRYNDVVIGPHAVLNVAGLWVNDSGLTGGDIQGSAFVNGGSVTITTAATTDNIRTGIVSGTVGSVTLNSNYQQVVVTDVTRSIVLSAGSVIDVSSGGYVGSNGKLSYKEGLPIGKGGSLTLQTYVGGVSSLIAQSGIGVGVVANNSVVTLLNGQIIPAGTQIFYFNTAVGDSSLFSKALSPTDGVLRANVVMNGSVRAAGFAGGGTLTLQAPKVTIDGAATQIASYRSGSPRSGELVLPASFFTDNAFSQYVLTSAVGNLTVTAGTTINLRQSSYLAPAAAVSIPTGASVGDFAAVGLAPDAVRKPVSLTPATIRRCQHGSGYPR